MTLVQLFTAIANAIRAKTGSSDTIVAEDFPDEIADITTGHLDNAEYAEANDDLDDILEGSTPMTIFPPDWSELGYTETPQSILNDFNYSKNIKDNWNSSETNLKNKFLNNTDLKYMPLVDTSNATSFYSCFQGCNNLTNIPLLNTSNVTTMASCFYNCYSLKSVPAFNTSNVTSFGAMVRGCSNLVDFPVLDFSKATIFSNMFTSCSKLSNDSLNNIMESCIGATSYTGTKTLAALGISSTLATICQGLSNYSAFTSAGWTTGY